MQVSLTVGKVDAGVAVLLTEDKRLIEFPSILLPPDIHSGSIVDVEVSRNFAAEKATAQSFSNLQNTILEQFGTEEPSTPVLRCRNATQTSVVLEWDPLSLATAELRSFSLYRNGSKAGSIPRPLEITSTKISGLAVDTEYTFQLVLRTSAGTFSSERLVIRTHKMTNLTGITITPGVMAPQLRESLEASIERIGAKLIEQVRIDTTHFVCTEEKGEAYKKAQDMNIPIVVPDWVKGCEREGRIVGVRAYYLGADPKLRQIGTGANLQREDSNADSLRREGQADAQGQAPTTHVTPTTPDRRIQDGDDDDEPEEEDDDGTEEDEAEPEEKTGMEKDGDAEEDDDEEEQDEEEGDSKRPKQVNGQASGKAGEGVDEAMEDVKL